MKNNLIIIKNNFLNLVYKIVQNIPSFKQLKNIIKNAFINFKEECVSIHNKSKNLLNTNIELGLYHFYKGNISDAKFRFWLIGLFYRNFPIVYYNIGRCYFALGNITKAYDNFTTALKLNPNYDDAKYYIKKIENSDSIDCIPHDIIKQYFDYTGEYFLRHWLIVKQYKGPEYVADVIMNFFPNNLDKINILDLGCGTGICGQFLKMKNIGNHLVGVDFSNQMLKVAKENEVNGKQAYDDLINAEMIEFLQNNKKHYDVIIVSEVLHYLGDLKTIFHLIKSSLSKNGIIVGLVRRKEGEGYTFIKEGDFFCYSEHYLRSLASEIELEVRYTSYCKIYNNQVDGLLFALSYKS